MSSIELIVKEKLTWVRPLGEMFVLPGIFLFAFLGYYLSNYSPNDWYQHNKYLAEALLHGTFDVSRTGVPEFYHDLIAEGSAKYVSFPPAPSLLLMPFVAIWGIDFSQIYFSMILGAVDVVLFWYLMGLLNITRTTKLLMTPFFAFGTVLFFTATTGTAWHYVHVASVFYALLAIIFLLRRSSPLLPGIFLGLAFLSREPTIMAAPFFGYWIVRQRHDPFFSLEGIRAVLRDRKTLYQFGLFCAGLLPFIAFFFWYNNYRFGSPLDTGYDVLYNNYQGISYNLRRAQAPDAEQFNMFDLRNIPISLHTLFLMPPDFFSGWSLFRPSPYGLSVLFTSPAFVYAFLVKGKSVLKPACWLAIIFVSAPLLLHYSQGWVQFGYRFLLDFAPYLLILTALGFDAHTSMAARRWQFGLVLFSVAVGFWGRHWATELGW